MDSALTVLVVVGIIALAAAGAAAFYSGWRRRQLLERHRRPAVVERVVDEPMRMRTGAPARRTVEEERVRRTVRERTPADAAFADSDLDDFGRPPM
jgi:hypothetical protein